MTAPLAGIKVVDQTQALAGPYAAMILGDLGADVIKIERPGVGDNSRQWAPPFIGDQSAYYLAVNRNKRGIALNIRAEAGRAIMHQLASEADVFMTNLATTASLQRSGIDYDTLRALNPRLIYASISGYGRRGPRAGQPGYDLVSQAESGTMYLTGEVDGAPMRFPTPIADMTCGLFTVIGVLAALRARDHNGEGQFIDMSLQEGQITWLENYAGEYFVNEEDPPRRGNRHPQVVPYEAVQGSDGDWFILGVGSDNVWRSFCRYVGREQLAADVRFATNAGRIANYEALLPIVREIIRAKPCDQWLAELRAAGVPCGRINTVAEALEDPHLLERGMIIELEHPALGMVKSLATPVHLSDSPLVYHRHPPRLGEHSDEVAAEMGYDQPAIARLRAEGVLA
ncbi:MAG: CaiB/BaiF CoA-transferase family protein [Chloroflexi bacterium]|nr:CaiB/BaiF CoA-transferase family protein [Chloroflexota bacterium]MCY3581536.1 CaiB/BaiF CoA-transferase family protein [Chloroflexota bacterium]MCY3716743.1 CaiB/BaiF CoA-transferase family protein [Chloroflexota bacterium]MDE2651093.1 CaiB/BaiF CoA-transferase family protein [Chloroflexota bacterium]MXV94274.1 CoA transferase [Chloroflexota bacterium]